MKTSKQIKSTKDDTIFTDGFFLIFIEKQHENKQKNNKIKNKQTNKKKSDLTISPDRFPFCSWQQQQQQQKVRVYF